MRSAALVLAAALAAHAANPLVGTWRLESSVETKPGGEIFHARGAAPIGLLIYDAAGNMSVQIMSAGQGSACEPYTAYFGTYEVVENGKRVIHRLQGSLIREETGRTRTRSIDLAGDTLTLTSPESVFCGERMTRKLVWRRVPTRPAAPRTASGPTPQNSRPTPPPPPPPPSRPR